MLDIEFAHAATPGFIRENSLLSEFRRSHAPTGARSPGPAKATPGGIWLFAIADAAEAGDDHTLPSLARGFHSSPAREPAGITFSHLFRDAMLQPGQTAPHHPGVVACGLCFDRAVVAHSGRSGCYLVRQNHATRLTLSNVELIDYQIQPGDVLLLCGEAMHRAVKGSEMAAIVGHRAELRSATERLLHVALEREPQQALSLAAIRILNVERLTHTRASLRDSRTAGSR